MKKKVFITKYALTRGILEVEAELVPSQHGETVYASTNLKGLKLFTNEFEETEKAAFARAETMRARRLASLRRAISKAQKHTFKVVQP